MERLEKALDVLEIFLQHEGELRISQLASLSGLNVSTAYRLASTLVKRGYLSRQQKRGKYSLGLKLLGFSSAIKKKVKVRDAALPFLEKLNAATGEAVNLAILDSSEAVYIEHLESHSYLLRMFTEVGNRVSLHCTGVGKTFLANMREEELQRYLNCYGLPQCTSKTITDTGKLKNELLIAKRDGIAEDDEETELGVRCIASPVKDGNGNVVAAVSISGPSARLNSDRVRELKLLVKNCGLEISQAIGYRGE
ncbi:MAG: IclR family transcriptional regulator [Dehalococcoidales bacterium]